MNLSKEALDELKEIHFQETGKLLTNDEALAMARQLFRVYRVLYSRKPDNSSDPNLDQ
jgi:hypothetical protein